MMIPMMMMMTIMKKKMMTVMKKKMTMLMVYFNQVRVGALGEPGLQIECCCSRRQPP